MKNRLVTTRVIKHNQNREREGVREREIKRGRKKERGKEIF